MPIKDLLKNIEEIGIFSEDLKNQIDEYIVKIKDNPYLADELLNILNKNLELAEKKGVNVKKYNDLIFNFRLTILKSNIENFIDDYKDFKTIGEYDISSIETEYNYLIKNTQIFGEERIALDKSISKLIEKSKVGRLLFRLKNAKNNDDLLGSEFSEIMEKMNEYDSLGYDISDLENEIMD